MTHNFINDVENGKKWVSPETIAKLAQCLEVEPFQFFLPDIRMNEGESAVLQAYLEDLSNSVMRVMEETKSRYLKDSESGTSKN
jgi:transcriptional regulator with XRE-family HTH domain